MKADVRGLGRRSGEKRLETLGSLNALLKELCADAGIKAAEVLKFMACGDP